MRNSLSQRECRETLYPPKLNAIWYVEADHSYNVTKQRHVSSAWTAVRTVAGAGALQLQNGECFELPAGSLAIFDSELICHYYARENGWQFYWFEFELPTIPFLQNRCAPLPVSTQELREMDRCFQNLSRSLPCECRMADALFSLRLADWQQQIENTVPDAGSVLALLEKGRRERLSVEDLAREAGMCVRSFREAVHAVTGLSPKAYLLKGDMAAATELLRTTDMTVSEIAASLNYSNPFYFSRVFSKYHGFSPSEARTRRAPHS